MEDKIMDIKALNTDLAEIILELSSILGKPISADKFEIVDLGIPHQPTSLPKGKMGIGLFIDDINKIKKLYRNIYTF